MLRARQGGSGKRSGARLWGGLVPRRRFQGAIGVRRFRTYGRLAAWQQTCDRDEGGLAGSGRQASGLRLLDKNAAHLQNGDTGRKGPGRWVAGGGHFARQGREGLAGGQPAENRGGNPLGNSHTLLQGSLIPKKGRLGGAAISGLEGVPRFSCRYRHSNWNWTRPTGQESTKGGPVIGGVFGAAMGQGGQDAFLARRKMLKGTGGGPRPPHATSFRRSGVNSRRTHIVDRTALPFQGATCGFPRRFLRLGLLDLRQGVGNQARSRGIKKGNQPNLLATIGRIFQTGRRSEDRGGTASRPSG